MRLLVTGANGYLGKGITKKLLDYGCDVVCIDFDNQHIDKRASFIKADLFHFDEYIDSIGQIDCLLHLAWRDGFVHSSFSHIKDLPNHVSFIERLIDCGVKKIAVMGSMHEVGFYEGCVDENTPCNPMSLYGISKNALRQVVIQECKKARIECQWLRGFYIVGNTPDGSSIFSKLVRAKNEGKTDFPFTTGKNKYDFLDYDVFCDYVAKTVMQDRVNGIINICSGEPVSLSNKVEQFILDNSLGIKLMYGVFPDRPYDSKAIWGDNSKIKEILGNEK